MSSLKIVGIVSGAVLVVFVVGSLVVKMAMLNSASPVDTDLANAMDNAAAAVNAESQKWTYSKETDAVRQTTNHYAQLMSDNEESVSGVDPETSYLSMMVRRDHEGDAVMFSVAHGQFACSIQECSGAINVDGHQHAITLKPPADGTDNVVFAHPAGTVVKELAGAKKVVVELPFYHHGPAQYTSPRRSPSNGRLQTSPERAPFHGKPSANA